MILYFLVSHSFIQTELTALKNYRIAIKLTAYYAIITTPFYVHSFPVVSSFWLVVGVSTTKVCTSDDQIQLVSNFRYFTSGVEVVSAICARISGTSFQSEYTTESRVSFQCIQI